jgi:3-dehydroquinate synthase
MSFSELLMTESVDVLLQNYCQDHSYREIVVLCDTNTQAQCFPLLNKPYKCIVMPAGEQHKTLREAEKIVDQLMAYNFSKQTLLVNLGGGVVSDMGGFVASIYKRGIPFINVPTTLMGMVDAAIGGKTGVDHAFAKNIIGSIYHPKAVLIDLTFLNTMPAMDTLLSFAELFKIAIIADAQLWKKLIQNPWPSPNSEALKAIVKEAVQNKIKLVEQDPYDASVRQLLNFGHTYGHAYESFVLNQGSSTSHADAVLWGMRKEIELAVHLGLLTKDRALTIIEGINQFEFPCSQWQPNFEELLPFLLADKKNTHQSIGFSLPIDIGQGQIQIQVNVQQLKNCYSLSII